MEITLKLSDDWRSFIEAETTAGGHATPADYVHMLVVQARLYKARTHINSLIEEGIASGPAEDWTDDDWRDIDQKIEDCQARQSSNVP